MNLVTEKKILLLQSQLFKKLRDEEIDIIVRYSEFKDLQAGEVIFTPGTPAESLYIISDGEVLITKTGAESNERDVARYLSGECFGELSFFRKSHQDARAVAISSSRILLFPSSASDFWDIAGRHAEIFANILNNFIAIIAGRIRSTNRLINDKTPWLHELKRNLYTDKLTGIFNKNYLDEDFPDSIYNMDSPVSILMIKPDNFKIVNDTYGHDSGDRVLRILTIFIQSLLKENDVAVRYRGDEFAVVLTGLDYEDVLLFAGEIQHTIYTMDLTNALGTDSIKITCSIGMAIFPEEAQGAEDLIKIAHDRMTSVWDSGGNAIKGRNAPEQ